MVTLPGSARQSRVCRRVALFDEADDTAESFFEQTGVAACNIGTGFLPHQASMRTDFEFLNYTAENSLAICRTQ